ncbi:major facilitator superfamily domain-containing protein 10-like [Artemia franciscana]|uniref:Major facilitator superfamily (MFS) profile domain-containing protein n=1 Tax=Artemia franciscana TaxID=6661 RepID=A0AA88LHP4_ARTSF|nr:hypothetical protein QYM36_002574 [Artemia franciscana]
MSDKANKVILWKLFGSLVLDLLAFTVILPLLPTLMDHFAVHDTSGLYSYLRDAVAGMRSFMGATEAFDSVLFGGILGSLFSLLQFLASPVIGTLSDIFGRKPIFIMTSVGLAISYGLWAVASNFFIFIIARIIGGVSKGNISLAAAIIADVLPVESRGFGMALMGIAFSLGFIFGPMLGAGFAMWAKLQDGTDWFAYPALFSLTLTLVNIVFLTFFFPETLPKGSRAKSNFNLQHTADHINPKAIFSFTTAGDLPKKDFEQLKWLGRIYFLFLFVYSGLEFTFSFLTHLKFGFTPRDQGKMFLFVGVSMALVQGGIGRRIKKEQQTRIALLSMLVTAPSFVIIGLSNSVLMLYFGLFLYAAGSAMVVPSMTMLVSECGPIQRRGIILGNFRSIGALARATGPLVGSFMFWSFGSALCYSLGTLGMLVPSHYLWKKIVNVNKEHV